VKRHVELRFPVPGSDSCFFFLVAWTERRVRYSPCGGTLFFSPSLHGLPEVDCQLFLFFFPLIRKIIATKCLLHSFPLLALPEAKISFDPGFFPPPFPPPPSQSRARIIFGPLLSRNPGRRDFRGRPFSSPFFFPPLFSFLSQQAEVRRVCFSSPLRTGLPAASNRIFFANHKRPWVGGKLIIRLFSLFFSLPAISLLYS